MKTSIEKIHRDLLADEHSGLSPLSGRFFTAVVFANTYHVGMSNLAFQWLYHEVNADPDFFAERIFLPHDELNEAYIKQGSALRTLETSSPAKNAMAWFVTLPFENDYVNLVRLLDLAGIRPMSARRKKTDPLIIVGGAAPMLNPEPIAPIADVVIFGEGRKALIPFLDRMKDHGGAVDRLRFLQSLSDLPHVYVPRYYKPRYDKGNRRIGMDAVKKFPERLILAKEDSIDDAATFTHVLTPNTEFSDTLLIETYRGCSARCRFCAAGHLFLPPRQRSIGPFKKPKVPSLGEKAVGLVGSGVSGHDKIETWIEWAGRRGRVGISSVRLDTLNEKTMAALVAQGAKSVAIAPEAGTRRLRGVCNKDFTDEEIALEAHKLVSAGFVNLKLYFLVGLPTQTPADLAAIATLAVKIRNMVMPIWKQRKNAGVITLSINPFVPKAHTPFMWAPFCTKNDYDQARKVVGTPLKREGNIRVRFGSYRESRLQAILSMADRDGADLLLMLARGESGNAAIRKWSTDADKLICRPKSFDEVLPFDFIDTGIDRKYLMDEYHRAMDAKLSPGCKPKCKLCGVCR